MSWRESTSRRQLRWALVGLAGGAVVAYGCVVPGGIYAIVAYVLAAALSWSTIRRMPTPPVAAEGAVGIGLALGLAEELWRTGSLVLAAGTLLAVVQGLLAPRAAGRLHRWAVAGGVVGHLLAGTLWPMSTAAGTAFLCVLAVLGIGTAWTLALAHRVSVAAAWAGGPAVASAARLESDGAGRGSWGRASWLSISALILASVTFVLVPRPRTTTGSGRPGGSGLFGDAGLGRDPFSGRPDPVDQRDASTGFRDNLQFDDMGPIKQDPRVAMRVRSWKPDHADREHAVRPGASDGQRGDLLLRGMAVNHYQGGRWTSANVTTRSFRDRDDGQADNKTAVARPPRNATYWRTQIEPLAMSAPYAFHIGQLLAVGFPRVVYDGNGTAALDEAPEFDAYSVWSLAETPSSRVLEAAGVTPSPEFTQIPWRKQSTLDTLARVRRKLAGTETNPYRLARTLERAMRRHYEYTLSVPRPTPGKEPLSDFLLGKSPGHCEYFASTMVLLLRQAGVPCRLVGGYRTREFDPTYGTYIVRNRDAHAWVEVRFDGVGWVHFDPTPADNQAEGDLQVAPMPLPDLPPPPDMYGDYGAGFVDQVMAFDADQRESVLARTGGLWGLILLVGVVGLLGLFGLRGWQRWASDRAERELLDERDVAARRWRRSPPGFYATLVRVLAAAGFHRGASGTPRELWRAVRRGRGPDPDGVARVTRTFESMRYGEQPLHPDTEYEMLDAVDAIADDARS